MSKGKSDKITYKAYEQNQPYLIPPSADELIPQDHLVRLVSEVIDEMGIEKLLRKYQAGGGASRYHPVMMTKLFVYGYMTKVCSSRMVAKAARENVMFMWLAGSQKPDFRTLNDFRGKLLKEVMEEIFVTAVKMLHAKGYIKLENYFVDGTKIESASGRYTFVWKKAVEKNDKKLDEKLRAYIQMAEKAWDDENSEYGNRDLEEMGSKEQFTSTDVKELAGILRERLEALDAEEDKKKLKKELKTIEKDCLPRKKRYEKAKRICGKRNSYSKTDPDATFMRMKEDHMGNGQLKPAYNVQIGTENGFVVGYDLFPNPTDTKTLKPHLRKQAKRLGTKPKTVITDAGYGSEENYAYLENRQTTAVIKYNTYHKEKSRKWKSDAFRTEHWEYNAKEKYYVCPNGRKLTFRETKKEKNASGYAVTIQRYECESCKYCRMKKQCTKAQGNRVVERNERLLRLRKKARRILSDEHYTELRKRRSVEVETVFGQIKGNQGYRRFLLRGTAKVSAEWGLLSLGYNLKQIYRLNRDKTA
ncbi:MAG: IS1182 family transposase [Treponema sp.]|nr:IS1182 family transposase [Treponema sp.]